jgi:hypothetical protein
MDFYTQMLPLTLKMIAIFVTVNIIDGYILQSIIFSKSVRAHPLELFLVILVAATIAGIPGMILAIPSYTVLRIFAKEFLSKTQNSTKNNRKTLSSVGFITYEYLRIIKSLNIFKVYNYLLIIVGYFFSVLTKKNITIGLPYAFSLNQQIFAILNVPNALQEKVT